MHRYSDGPSKRLASPHTPCSCWPCGMEFSTLSKDRLLLHDSNVPSEDTARQRSQEGWNGMSLNFELSGTKEKRTKKKQKHFGLDGARDKQEPSLGQMGHILGTDCDPGINWPFSVEFHSKITILSRLFLSWVVLQGQSEKCLCVLCLLSFRQLTRVPMNKQQSSIR